MERRVQVLYLWLLFCQPKGIRRLETRILKVIKSGCCAVRLVICPVSVNTFVSSSCLTYSIRMVKEQRFIVT